MIEKIKDRMITPSASLLDAMKQMDEVKVKTLFVLKNEHFEGIVTLGDIQRAIIHNVSLREPLERIIDKDKVYGFFSEGEQSIKDKMRRMRAEVMPILDDYGELVDVWFWPFVSCCCY